MVVLCNLWICKKEAVESKEHLIAAPSLPYAEQMERYCLLTTRSLPNNAIIYASSRILFLVPFPQFSPDTMIVMNMLCSKWYTTCGHDPTDVKHFCPVDFSGRDWAAGSHWEEQCSSLARFHYYFFHSHQWRCNGYYTPNADSHIIGMIHFKANTFKSYLSQQERLESM